MVPMSKEKYTRKTHIARLLTMLATKTERTISYSCPACKHFSVGGSFLYESGPDQYSFDDDNPYCDTCRRFVDVPLDDECCPCDYYGPEKAIEITKKKLRELGFLCHT
jgi:hypothetical protein